MYPLVKPLLFALDPERSHELTLASLECAHTLNASALLCRQPTENKKEIMGLNFPNPVGLAAGLDKNGDHIDALAALGFGFIEIGTITPRPQPGNPKPRLFRLPQHQAIINRMGFNNKGVDHLVSRVERSRFAQNGGVLGINIGKNFDTSVDKALDDYLICMDKVYDHASYITVNISSPNTPGLRDLQFGDSLNELLQGVKQQQTRLAEARGRYVPVVVKIAPDMDSEAIKLVADTLVQHQLDGVIATNTTISREAVQGHRHAEEAGGLSGLPVREASTRVITELADLLQGALPILGVGGIVTGDDAQQKIAAGADLVQLYSGLIYRGLGLINESAEAILAAGLATKAQTQSEKA